MKRQTKDPVLKELLDSAPETEHSLLSVDRLLRFVNQLSHPSDLVAVTGLPDPANSQRIADEIIARRLASGGFYVLRDLEALKSIDDGFVRAAIAASSNMILRPRWRSPGAAAIVAPLLLPRLLYAWAGDWVNHPPNWDQIGEFGLLMDKKRGMLEQKHGEAKKVRDRVKKYRDSLVADGASQQQIGVANRRLESAQETLDEAEREIDDLNDKVNDGDFAGAWAIVRANIVRLIAKLRREVDDLQEAGDHKAARRVAESLTEWANDLEATDDAIAALD